MKDLTDQVDFAHHLVPDHFQRSQKDEAKWNQFPNELIILFESNIIELEKGRLVEWFNAPVLNTGDVNSIRGFESLTFRFALVPCVQGVTLPFK